MRSPCMGEMGLLIFRPWRSGRGGRMLTCSPPPSGVRCRQVSGFLGTHPMWGRRESGWPFGLFFFFGIIYPGQGHFGNYDIGLRSATN